MLALLRLYGTATPQPIQRLEAIRLADWERQGSNWRIRAAASPRSFDSPMSRRSSRSRRAAARTAPSSTPSPRSASPRRTSRTTSVLARPDVDVADIADYALGAIAADRSRLRPPIRPGASSLPVRTYESPIDRRLAEAGFDTIARVTLLMKETVVRVAEPALVPAGVR